MEQIVWFAWHGWTQYDDQFERQMEGVFSTEEAARKVLRELHEHPDEDERCYIVDDGKCDLWVDSHVVLN